MGVLINEVGNRYGRLTVLSRALTKEKGRARWACKCDCGNFCEVSGKALRSKTKSCGCLQKESVIMRNTTHLKSKSLIYGVWSNMKSRCKSDSKKNKPFYKDKGITYDSRWETFENFWDDMGETYQEGLHLDRINSNKNYTKDNCRWVTPQQNAFNRPKGSRSKLSKYKGVYQLPSGKWRACARLNYKQHHVGVYDSEDAAAMAYNEKAKELHGEYASLNLLPPPQGV